MSFEIVEKNTVLREVTVTVSGEAVKRVEGKLVEQARKTLKMNGFRAGKVPANVIRQRAGASITEDARRECLQVSVREALDTISNLLHVSEVEIVEATTADGGFVGRLNAEVTPVIEANGYKNLTVAVADAVVTDEEIATELEALRERHAIVKPVEDRKTVQDGDVLQVTLSAPNAAAEKICRAGDRQITVGKGYFNEAMEKCLVGATVAEPVQLTSTMEDGEEAVVTCVVNEIKVRILPELNDEFALDTGDAETLEGLKAHIKENLTKAAEDRRNQAIDDAVLTQIRAAMPIDMPEGYVRARATQAIRLQLEQMFRQQLSDDMLERVAKNMKDEELNEYRVDYHNEIVLNTIAKAENIEVSEDDVLVEAKKWFPNMDESKIKHWLKANNAADFVGAQVKRDRALEAIKQSVTVNKLEAEG